jgi:hypothetical protein
LQTSSELTAAKKELSEQKETLFRMQMVQETKQQQERQEEESSDAVRRRR